MLTIYKASAGSGKTFQLARKYIQLLLGYQIQENGKWCLYPDSVDAHRGILAITFTNKATGEMKKRIIEELSLLADDKDCVKSNHLEYLAELFGVSQKSIGESAKKALESILTNFRDFNVSTIDSFFQSVLRSFAHELDLPDNFELKLDDSEIVSLAVEDLLNTVNGTSPLLEEKPTKEETVRISQWLRKYMDLKLTDGKTFNLFSKNGYFREEIIKLITSMMDERFKEHSDEITSWCTDLKRINDFEEYLSNQCKSVSDSLENYGKEITGYSDDYLLKKDFINIGKKLLQRQPLDLSSATWKKIKTGTENKENCLDLFKTSFQKLQNQDFFDQICVLCDNLYRDYSRLSLYRLLLKNIYPLGIFGQILKRIVAFRKKKSAFLLSDTNNFLHKIIGKDDTPFIYERIGTKFKHFLLDEFQDTSRLQWNNLRPLLLESLATDNDNLIIGDEKQCIYRFRNSDPALINSIVKKEISGRFNTISEKGTDPEENTNWRSDKVIVDFNNRFFTRLSGLIGLESFYSNTRQQTKSDEEKGYVNLFFTEGCEDYEFKYPVIENNETLNTSDKIALDRMAQNIFRQLDSGYKPSEIAVLVRRHPEDETVIRTMLDVFNTADLNNKPEIVSGDALTLGESPAVMYAVSKMKLFLLPDKPTDDELFYESYLNKPEEERRKLGNYFKKLENRRRTRLFLNKFHADSTGFTEESCNAALKHSLAFIDNPMTEVHATDEKEVGGNLVTLAENILDEYMSDHDNELEFLKATNENIYVSTFLDKVLEFEGLKGNNLAEFINWWDEKGKDSGVTLSENDNAVKVSTIHKSKGLEYDCVHLPFVNFDLYSSIRHGEYYWYEMKIDGVEMPDSMPPFMRLPVDSSVCVNGPFERQLELILANNRLDTLNLLYVAFTRAVTELIVTVTGSRKCEIEKTNTKISGPMSVVMSQIQPEEKRFYQFGSPTDGNGKNTRKIGEVVDIPMPPYRTNAYKSIDELTKPVNFHRIDWQDTIERGLFFHEVLSRTIHWDRLEYATQLTGYNYKLDDEKIKETIGILNGAYKSLKYKRWFEDYDALLSEMPVYFFEGYGEKNRRPDRIVIYSDGSIDIVDYKFANPEEGHAEQVRGYVRFFRSIGYSVVNGYLWYPLRKKVVKV